MKKYLVLLSVTAMMLVSTNEAFAQCSASKWKSKCIQGLADGFTFIKSYDLDGGRAGADGSIEYSFVFSKGTIYMINTLNSLGESKNVVVELFDPAHKKLATNLRGGQYYPLGYQCATTGVHYMKFTFKDAKDKCGISVLGFKR